jgi:murein DD-endopeptidase MepM/ murein hydrolase activator NlpD
LIVIVGLLVGAGAYVLSSKSFEREEPVIKSAEHLYWNRKDPLQVEISDNSALKSYEVSVSDGSNTVTVVNEKILESDQKLRLINIEYPKKAINGVMLNPKASQFLIEVKATDRSNWGLFQGNSTSKTITVDVDYKRPEVNILSNSYSVTRGGAGLIVFQVKDDSLKEFFVESGDRRFTSVPYREEGYYTTLVAWPFNQQNFSVRIVASDMAGNRRSVNVPFFTIARNYKTSWIEAKDRFIDGKISDLADSDPQLSLINDRVQKLKAINEDMRNANEELIHGLASKVSPDHVDEWVIQPFYPLKNAAKVASYGDERHYYYGNKENEVSQSYHVGLDLASTKMAQIISSNAGKVVYSDHNGIYGNMPMIDHGMGLFTLYGHCSNILVQEHDEISAGTPIAQTGVSGLALGDHLHFGVLVQGIEVRPEEWMDQRWLDNNINKIFKEANKIIDGV